MGVFHPPFSVLRMVGAGAHPTLRMRPLTAWHVSWYKNIMVPSKNSVVEVERVQTGVRIEKRLLKVLKALAELKDMSLGDLLEGIVLHAFEGKTPFARESLREIEQLRKLYGLTLKASNSHQLKEKR